MPQLLITLNLQISLVDGDQADGFPPGNYPWKPTYSIEASHPLAIALTDSPPLE
jgi:hypothetical protein